MNTKFAGTIILAGALLAPVFSYAADSSTDTPGAYLDDAGITTKVKAKFAGDKWSRDATSVSAPIRVWWI